jgi:hypothetical protein
MEASMPLSYPNRSRILVAPRRVVAFSAQDGSKLVCCLVATAALTRYFAGPAEQKPQQIFDLQRGLIEEAASLLYDEIGSDECGELILRDGDLRRSEAARLAVSLGADHRKALSVMGPRQLGFPPTFDDGGRIRVRTIPW